jgi:6-pyruvoyltetrahydropterin/6-carboxytetrahydropterin synthase
METLRVRGRFHTGHRQRQHDGKCRFLHGHTWHGECEVSCARFPRDELDMSIDFGALKAIFKDLDHRFLVTDADTDLLDPEGIVRLPGRGPSVENVAWYCLERIVAVIAGKYPDRGLTYHLRVTIAETDNNTFIVEETRTI